MLLSAHPLSAVPLGTLYASAVETILTVILRNAVWIDTTPLFVLLTPIPTFTQVS